MNPATQAYQRNVIARFGNLSPEGLAKMENAAMKKSLDNVAQVVRPRYVNCRQVDESYQKILAMAQNGGTVADFARALNRDPSTVRQHLRKMMMLGLIRSETVGQVKVYSKVEQEVMD